MRQINRLIDRSVGIIPTNNRYGAEVSVFKYGKIIPSLRGVFLISERYDEPGYGKSPLRDYPQL